jgi:hypothetical protein
MYYFAISQFKILDTFLVLLLLLVVVEEEEQ